MRCNCDLVRKLNESARSGYLYAPIGESERCSLRRRLHCGEVIEPYPGLYVPADFHQKATPRARAYMLIKTLSKRHPDWVFSSFSAALVHGLQVPYAHLSALHVSVEPGGNRRRCAGKVSCHSSEALAAAQRADIPPVTVVQGIRVTTVEHTVMECLCRSNFRDGLVVADSALHCSLTTKSLVERQFLEWGRGKRGIRQARATLAYADGGSESGGESLVRAAIIELGFAVPSLQVLVDDPFEPNNPKRVDMAWRLGDGSLVILEVDGKIKYVQAANGREKTLYEMAATFSKERRRESHLNMTGAKVLRCSVEDACDGEGFRDMLERAGVPRAMSAERPN